jgi:hypothetical protein
MNPYVRLTLFSVSALLTIAAGALSGAGMGKAILQIANGTKAAAK